MPLRGKPPLTHAAGTAIPMGFCPGSLDCFVVSQKNAHSPSKRTLLFFAKSHWRKSSTPATTFGGDCNGCCVQDGKNRHKKNRCKITLIEANCSPIGEGGLVICNSFANLCVDCLWMYACPFCSNAVQASASTCSSCGVWLVVQDCIGVLICGEDGSAETVKLMSITTTPKSW